MVSENNDVFKYIKVEVDKGNRSNGDVIIFSDKTLDSDEVYLLGVNELF